MSAKDEIKELMKKIAEEKGSNRNKRDAETRYMLWLDKELMKKLKLVAVQEETSVKQLIEQAVRIYLKEF